MTVPKPMEERDGRHAVILCHPDPRSFNHAIAACCCDEVRAGGQSIVLRDLYAMNFDPVLKAEERPTLADPIQSPDVTAERDVLAGCDVFVLIYPIWFGSPPAMMKGYVERVFGAGVAPEDVRKQVRGDLLGDKRLLSFSTSALSKVWLAQEGQEMGLGSVFDDYVVHAFGMHSREHKRFALITDHMDQRSVDTYLGRWRNRLIGPAPRSRSVTKRSCTSPNSRGNSIGNYAAYGAAQITAHALCAWSAIIRSLLLDPTGSLSSSITKVCHERTRHRVAQS